MNHETLETANAERRTPTTSMGSKVVQKRFSKVVENRGSCFPTPYYFFCVFGGRCSGAACDMMMRRLAVVVVIWRAKN